MSTFFFGLLIALFTVSAIGVIVYVSWSFILLCTRKFKWNVTETIQSQHHLFVMIPMLNECEVVRGTIEKYYAQAQIQHLTLHLVVLDDFSDDGTTEILEALMISYPQLRVVFREPPHAREGKGHALNEGLRVIKSYIATHHIPSETVIIGIMDADASIKLTDLSKVIRLFESDPALAMVQINIGMNNKSKWLYALQDLDFVACNYMIQNTRNHLRNAAASGNGQFFRLALVENRGDLWKDSLLEDFESSTRLLLDNLKTSFLADAIVLQEPVNGLQTLVKQRSRWAQGGIQCMGRYGTEIMQNKNIRTLAKVEMFFYILLPFFTAICCIGHAAAFVYQLFVVFVLHQVPHPILLIIIALATLISLEMGVVYAKQSTQKKPVAILLGLTIPLYNLIIAPACYIAIFRYLTRKDTWEKTQHTNKAQEMHAMPESSSYPNSKVS